QEGELTGSAANAVTGVERFNNMQAFVYGEFNRPVSFVGTNEAGKTRLSIAAVRRDYSVQDQAPLFPQNPTAPDTPNNNEPPPNSASTTDLKAGHKAHGAFSWLFPNKTRGGAAAVDRKPTASRTTDQGNVFEFRYGISFISAEQARKNLREEIPGWD